jgi:hypothetical protein
LRVDDLRTLFYRSFHLVEGLLTTPPPFRRPATKILRFRLRRHGRSHDTTLRSLTRIAAPFVPPPPCWTAQNATSLLLSRCHRYSRATTSLIRTGSRISVEAREGSTHYPYACTSAFGWLPHTPALLLPSSPDLLATGTETPPLTSPVPPFLLPPNRSPTRFLRRGRLLPDRVRRLPPDLV